MKPTNAAMLSDTCNNRHPGASQVPIKQLVVVSPITRNTEVQTTLRPLNAHLGSAPPLSPPFGAGRPCNTPAMFASPRKSLKKPKRPLTAYHIYFQIEREFIIQTLSGEDADQSILEGKIFFTDVPDRYRATKLSPDWYFGPGKRAKRKHRKQHGKIGFLELSRVITSRWTKLEETDPEIKQFVFNIAKEQNEEYKRELKEYRENVTKNMILPAVISKSTSNMKKQSASQVNQQVAMMPPRKQTLECRKRPPRTASSPFYDTNQRSEEKCVTKPPVPEVDQHQNEIKYSFQQRTPMWGKPQPKDDFDYCISLIENNTEVLPEQHPCRRDSIVASSSALDPKLIFDRKSDEACIYDEPANKSPSGTLNFVDICDDDIMSMWNTTNRE
eukprot:scaffold10534_cov150-Skeletonema_menzelii.AAC.2